MISEKYADPNRIVLSWVCVVFVGLIHWLSSVCMPSLLIHFNFDCLLILPISRLIGCIDACILATLAFILATRHVRLQPEPMYQNSMFKGKALNRFHRIVDIWTNCHVAGEVNNAYLTDAVSMAGSRKSLNLQPVLLVAPPHHMTGVNGDDSVSQFSNRTPSRYNRSDFHNSMHHFQL